MLAGGAVRCSAGTSGAGAAVALALSLATMQRDGIGRVEGA